MKEEKKKKISKFLSYVLRHRPDKIGITLDENGWTDVLKLIQLSSDEIEFTLDELIEVVETSDKKRFALTPDCKEIRANQGHSVKVDLDLYPITPPDKLYHGTANRFLKKIYKEGLKRMNRHHVHLYSEENIKKASDTGARHEKGKTPVVLVIDAKKMHKDGYIFYKTENNVYLTERVPKRYIIEKK
jgi:putative RNA 2'-phosphotransferase